MKAVTLKPCLRKLSENSTHVGVIMTSILGLCGSNAAWAGVSDAQPSDPGQPSTSVTAAEDTSSLGTFDLSQLTPTEPEREKPFSLTLKLGGGYESDVAISQTNTSTGQSDTLANLGLSASYKPIDSHGRSLAFGYDFNQSLHSKLSAYDIQLHSASVTGSVKVKKAYLGLTYSFNHVLLANRPFLDMHFTSPSLLVPLTPKIYLRASYIYLDETFLTDRTRDAKHYRPGLQIFYFFNHSKSFVLLGGNLQREKTVGPEFIYRGYDVSASLNVPLKLLKRTGKFKAEFERTNRDYDNITPSIGAKRFDRSSTYTLGAEMPLIKKLSLGLELKHISRKSNLDVSNIDDNAASVDLILRF